MQKESRLQTRRAEVAEELRRCIGMQALRRFGFENELVVDDHVECLPGKRLSPIVHRDRHFTIDPVAPGHQLSFQGERVDVFPKSEPQHHDVDFSVCVRLCPFLSHHHTC